MKRRKVSSCSDTDYLAVIRLGCCKSATCVSLLFGRRSVNPAAALSYDE